MKRILALALAATMMFGLVACGDSGSASSGEDSGARKIVYAFRSPLKPTLIGLPFCLSSSIS